VRIEPELDAAPDEQFIPFALVYDDSDALIAVGAVENPDGTPMPVAIREGMMFPYRAGFSFVAALRRRQPWSSVDAAFGKPPRSTEQVIHPERYLADDLPVPVAFDSFTTLRGYSVAHNTVWGELGFSLFLRSHEVDPATTTLASTGWGGDRALVLVRDDDGRPQKAVAIARTEWDTEADAIEAEEAAVKALDSAVTGAIFESTATRTRWFGLDGSVSWVERKGPSVVVVIGAPVWAADALGSEVWTASHVGKQKPKPKQKP